MLSFTFALLVLQFLIFPHHQNREISFFSDVVSTRLNIQSLMENIREYAIHFQLLFEQELPHWLNLLLFYTTLFFLIAGFIRALRKGIDFKLLALFSYLLFLLIYPYNGACIRFLIPVLPLILFYVTEGIVSVISLIRYPNAITASFIFLLLLSNAKTLWLDARQNKNEFGPYNASIQNDFRTIDKTVPADAVIAFSKPFVINLFCKRDAFYDNKNNIADIKNKADYVLLVTDERLYEVYIPESFLPVTGTDTLELEHFLLIKTH